MEKFVSSWCDGKTLPEKYIFPTGVRPGDNLYPKSNVKIPVIDLGNDDDPDHHATVVNQIIEASQELGAFQIINHGLPREVMDETRRVCKEFFELPAEYKSKFISYDPTSKFCLYTSYFNYNDEEIHLWRDALTQKCEPLEECLPYWPEKPDGYREIVGEYIVKSKEVGARILELIGEGLGMEAGYLGKELSKEVKMNVNHYPPCPDPSLTLGTNKHSDSSLLTILLQGQGNVAGLQCCKDGEWTNVYPTPGALVVFLGHIMQIVSNGKLTSADHRSVTNREETRQSIAFFLSPTKDCVIEPAKVVVTPHSPASFKTVTYREFLLTLDSVRRVKANPEDVIKPFAINV